MSHPPTTSNSADDSTQSRAAPNPDGTTYDFDVSIGLLCYRDKQFIDDLLASIAASSRRFAYEYLLSDNGSTDGTREMIREKYPYVTILENGDNLGVAGGRNRLFWNSRAKYTMILDSDTLVHDGCIDRLIETAEANPRAAIVAPKLVYRDGSLQLSIRPFPRLHHIIIEGTKYRKYFEWTGIPARVDMRNVSHDELMPFDCVYGAAMLVRNSVARAVSGFDEGYFYQYEDYDLCFRAKQAGYENWYDPRAVATHFYEREERGVFHRPAQNASQVNHAFPDAQHVETLESTRCQPHRPRRRQGADPRLTRGQEHDSMRGGPNVLSVQCVRARRPYHHCETDSN